MSGIRIAEASAKWAQDMKQKDDEHFAALCAAGVVSDEELVTRHYKLIAETLICAACPRCGLYVPEFDACCVLQCGRRDGAKWTAGYGCGIYMCAWCLNTSDDEKGCTEHVKLAHRIKLGGATEKNVLFFSSPARSSIFVAPNKTFLYHFFSVFNF
jgi:hypothetical protein